jgi:hypothetical protein
MTKRDKQKQLRDLERIIVDGVSGMDIDDTLGSVKVHYADGSADWLVNIIERADALRHELRNQ